MSLFGSSGVSVEIVPTSGKSTKKNVEIKGTGVSLKEFLKIAGLDAYNMNITVDGEPADMRTHVGKDSKVKLTEKARGS
jgi:hypothetical protein